MTQVSDNGKPRTVLLDFDGVIHDYARGWLGPVPTGGLLKGAGTAIRELKAVVDRVEIYSTRPRSHIIPFLRENHLLDLVDDVRDGKPYYVAFFDDRAHNVRSSRPFGLRYAVRRWIREQEETDYQAEGLANVEGGVPGFGSLRERTVDQ